MNSKDKLKRLNRLKQFNQKLISNLATFHTKEANDYLYWLSDAYQTNQKNSVLTTSHLFSEKLVKSLNEKNYLENTAKLLFQLNPQHSKEKLTDAQEQEFLSLIKANLETAPLFQHQENFRFLFFPLLLVTSSTDTKIEIDERFKHRIIFLQKTQAALNMIEAKFTTIGQTSSFNNLRKDLNDIKKYSHDKKNIFIDLLESFLLIIDNIFQFIVGLVLLFPNKIGLIESHYVGTLKHLLDCIINVLIQTVRLITAVVFPIHMLYSKFTTNSFNSIMHENERIIESMNEILNELDPPPSEESSSDELSSEEDSNLLDLHRETSVH